MKIVMSAGHGLKVRGAAGPPPPSWGLDEVDEARRVVTQAAVLRNLGVDVTTYWDDVSTSQSENLTRICDFHTASQGPVLAKLSAVLRFARLGWGRTAFRFPSRAAGRRSARWGRRS